MRIALVNWTDRRAGGSESYLEDLIPRLLGAGHQVALWHETAEPHSRPRIALPRGLSSWNAAVLGGTVAVDALRSWRPTVLYGHGMLDPALEARLLDIAPGVFLLHSYYGTCISGAKTLTFPTVRPCHRRFGLSCLALYYPRRTGGLDPRSAIGEYRHQARRLAVLRRYRAILATSEHMRREFLQHGIEPDRMRKVTHFVPEAPGRPPLPQACGLPSHLLFVGRMDPLKGGSVLLEALPQAMRALGRPLKLTFVGDGPARCTWEVRAREVMAGEPDLAVRFAGWLTQEELEREYAQADLLVVPSLWPEPFGRVGPEAGLRGLPAAAFDVGGISEWLQDGIAGHLAAGDRPQAEGLAKAIVACLADDAHHRRLADGARAAASRFNIRRHLDDLEAVFSDVTQG